MGIEGDVIGLGFEGFEEVVVDGMKRLVRGVGRVVDRGVVVGLDEVG